MNFVIRIQSPAGHVHISVESYTSRDAAREEIRRLRRAGGWEGCRFWTLPA